MCGHNNRLNAVLTRMCEPRAKGGNREMNTQEQSRELDTANQHSLERELELAEKNNHALKVQIAELEHTIWKLKQEVRET
jgi:hypothetical protein